MALFTFPISHIYRFNLFFLPIKVNFAWSRKKKKIYIDIQLLYLFTKKIFWGFTSSPSSFDFDLLFVSL